MTVTLRTPPPGLSPTVFIDPHGDAPLRAEAYGLERLESYALDLATAAAVTDRPAVRPPLLRRLRDNGRFLAEANRQIGTAARGHHPLSADAEWLLDNYYIIEEVLREVQHDLPQGYYHELPALAGGPLAGYPRVFALALGLIAHTDSALAEGEILHFVHAFQTVTQ